MSHTVSDSPEYRGSIGSYIVGFIGSIIITLSAFWLVTSQRFEPWVTVVVIMTLAVVQCYVQLVFFLHINKTVGQHWRLATLIFTILIMLVIGVGSIWVMNDLNGRMHASPQDMLEYMEKEQGL